MALDNIWLDSDDWMQTPRDINDSDDDVQELSPPPRRERPLPSSIRYTNQEGVLELIPMSQVAYALRERFLIDINQLPLDIIEEYVTQWRKEVDYENAREKDRRELPIPPPAAVVTVQEPYVEEGHDPPTPLPRRVHPEDVLEDLWARHITEKNEYVQGSDGRRIVRRRVFQRRDAPGWAWDCCHYCLSPGVVCREHQFELRGNDGVDRYVKEVVQTGWFRHAWCVFLDTRICWSMSLFADYPHDDVATEPTSPSTTPPLCPVAYL